MPKLIATRPTPHLMHSVAYNTNSRQMTRLHPKIASPIAALRSPKLYRKANSCYPRISTNEPLAQGMQTGEHRLEHSSQVHIECTFVDQGRAYRQEKREWGGGFSLEKGGGAVIRSKTSSYAPLSHGMQLVSAIFRVVMAGRARRALNRS